MVDRVWLAFKLLLSFVLVAAPLALFVVAPRARADPVFIGISAMLLFFAALPWVSFTTPNRGLGLSGIMFSLGVAFFAGRNAFGYVPFPHQCTGRRVAFCEFENLLFAAGGKYLAAAPLAIIAVLLLAVGIRMIDRAGNEH